MRNALSSFLVLLVAIPLAAAADAPARSAERIVDDALRAAGRGRAAPAQAKPLSLAALALLELPQDEVGMMHRESLQGVLRSTRKGTAARAQRMQSALRSMQGDMRFRPYMEAAMPPGFPAAGPVGKVVVKEYPGYRAARVSGSMSFMTLFMHIKRNRVEMTAPVEMTMDNNMRERSMAFLYEGPKQGRTGRQGRVAVLDLAPKMWLSVGLRGSRSTTRLTQAKRWLETYAKEQGYARGGAFRVMGYNSPRIRGNRRFWEVQMPVAKAAEASTKAATK